MNRYRSEKAGNLARPLGGVAAKTVGEDEREAVAVAFVVDVDTVEKGSGHGTLLGDGVAILSIAL